MKLFFVFLLTLISLFSAPAICSKAYISNPSYGKGNLAPVSCAGSTNCYYDTYVVGDIDIVDDGTTDNRKVSCAAGKECVLGIFGSAYYKSGMAQGSYPYLAFYVDPRDVSKVPTVKVTNGETFESALKQWVTSYGRSGRKRSVDEQAHNANNNNSIDYSTVRACLSIYSINDDRATVNSQEISCQPLPNPPVICDSLPDMTFDHGSISPGDNLQNTVHKTAILHCNATTSVTFSLSTAIKLDNSIINHFSINGKTLDNSPQKIMINGSVDTTVDFSSEIVSASKGGTFAGSSILIMTLQ